MKKKGPERTHLALRQNLPNLSRSPRLNRSSNNNTTLDCDTPRIREEARRISSLPDTSSLTYTAVPPALAAAAVVVAVDANQQPTPTQTITITINSSTMYPGPRLITTMLIILILII